MIFTNQQKEKKKKGEENPKIQDCSKGWETKYFYKEIAGTALQNKGSWAMGVAISDTGRCPGRPGCSPAILKQGWAVTLPRESLVSIIQLKNIRGQLGSQVNRSGWAGHRTGQTHTLTMPWARLAWCSWAKGWTLGELAQRNSNLQMHLGSGQKTTSWRHPNCFL